MSSEQQGPDETFCDTERKLRDHIEQLEHERDELREWKRYWSGELDVILAGRADETARADTTEERLAKAMTVIEAERKTADHLIEALKLSLAQSQAETAAVKSEAYSAAYSAVHVMKEIAKTGARIAFGVTDDPEICLGPIILPDKKIIYCSASFTGDEWSFYFEVDGTVFRGVLPNLEMPDGLISAIFTAIEKGEPK